MEIVKGLNGYLTARKDTDVPICVVFFYILHYMCLNGIYFSQEYGGVDHNVNIFHVNCLVMLSITKMDLNTLKHIKCIL
jgi:hypothetical protein